MLVRSLIESLLSLKLELFPIVASPFLLFLLLLRDTIATSVQQHQQTKITTARRADFSSASFLPFHPFSFSLHCIFLILFASLLSFICILSHFHTSLPHPSSPILFLPLHFLIPLVLVQLSHTSYASDNISSFTQHRIIHHSAFISISLLSIFFIEDTLSSPPHTSFHRAILISFAN